MASTAVLDLVVSLKDEASSGLASLGSSIGGLSTLATVGGGALVGAIGAVGATAFNTASDVHAASNQMQAALGATDAAAAGYEDTMKSIFANNFGADFADIAGGITATEQAMGRLGGAGDNLQQLTEDAFALRDVFGIDIPESTNAAATLMDTFGLTGEQAMDFITKGMQDGLNASDDLLDTIGEYSVQFREGGADAEDFYNILQSGMQGGMLGTDKAGDAFKEFRVRIQDGSDATYEALQRIGISADDLNDRMADGSTTAAEAWTEVQNALLAVDDQNIRMQAGVALMGTQYEDLGEDVVLAMTMAGTSLEDMAGATDALNVKYNDLGSAMAGAWRTVQLALAPIGDELLNLANAVMPQVQAGAAWIGEQLPGWIAMAKTAIDQLVTTAMPALQQAFAFVQEHAEAFKMALIAMGAVLAGAAVLGAVISIGTAIAALASPIGIIVIAAGALGAAWATNFGGIQEKTAAVWAVVEPILANAQLWLATNLPIAIQALTNFWTNTLLPAIQRVASFVQANIIPLLTALANVVIAAVITASEGLAVLWTTVLQPALASLASFVRDTVGPALSWLNTSVVQPLVGSFGGVVAAIQSAINWLNQLAALINSIDFGVLMPGSPTPFELGIRGITDAMKELSREGAPVLAGTFDNPAIAAGGSFGGAVTINLNGATIRSEDDIDELAYRIQSVLQRRA